MSGRRREPRTAAFPRTARVNGVLREVIADALERLADSDERLGLVTVTAVDTTPDLQRAVVYVSSLSEEVAAVLVSQRVHLQHEVARQVRMKRTPHLEFESDPAIAHGWRVEEILRDLAADPASEGASDEAGNGAANGASDDGAAGRDDEPGRRE